MVVGVYNIGLTQSPDKAVEAIVAVFIVFFMEMALVEVLPVLFISFAD